MNKKVGYYIVGNQEFFSKIQATLYASQNNLDVTWRFNNDIFDKFNWQVEPEESLDQLYDARARELREKYDYLMVSYSGGSDSHNLMQSFIRQGLHVDELLVVTTDKMNQRHTQYDVSNTKAENLSAEHILNTIPRLNEIKKQCPNIKVTIHDMTDNLIEMLSQSEDGDWVLSKREIINPIGMSRFNYKYISDVRKKFDSSKKIAVIFGIEKPRTIIKPETNEFLLYFNDRAVNYPASDSLAEYVSNIEIEYFYWSPSCVKMLCKQGHVIKKWLEVNPQYQSMWVSGSAQDVLSTQEEVLKNIIYTTWNNNWYQVGKAIKDWDSELANGFFKEFKGTDILKKWDEGTKFLQQHTGKFLKKDMRSFKQHSIFYKIGTICSNK